MMWFVYGVMVAVLSTMIQVLTKVSLKQGLNSAETVCYSKVLTGLCLFPIIFVPNLVTIPGTMEFYRSAWAAIMLSLISSTLITEVIRTRDLSYAMPFLATSPIFSIFLAWWLRGETISVLGAIGILVILIGSLTVGASCWRSWLQMKGIAAFKDRGIWLVLISAFVASSISVFEKMTIRASDTYTSLWYIHVFRGVLFAALYTFLVKVRIKEVGLGKLLNRKLLLIMVVFGFVFSGRAVLTVWALDESLVAYFEALKRLSLMMTVFAGLYFGENVTRYRVLGAGIMVAGAILIGMA